jgi:hypothetical protein
VGNANSGRYPKLTSEERKRIVGLVAEGMRPRDVAREVARSAGFVHPVIRDAGCVARRLPRPGSGGSERRLHGPRSR